MANRSYLFAFDEFENGKPRKPRGVHEWNWAIPISHLLLISGRPRVYRSSIWDAKIAIVADCEPGVARLLGFLHALAASGALTDGEVFAGEVRKAEEFLGDPKNKGRFFLLEAGEIFALQRDPGEKQAAKLAEVRVPTMAKQVDAQIAKSPARLFTGAPAWLTAVRDDWTKADLGLGDWSSVLWFKLD